MPFPLKVVEPSFPNCRISSNATKILFLPVKVLEGLGLSCPVLGRSFAFKNAGKAEPNRKHAKTASVSLKVTGLPGGTGNPYSRGKSRLTAK